MPNLKTLKHGYRASLAGIMRKTKYDLDTPLDCTFCGEP
jgi:hypothetical protein